MKVFLLVVEFFVSVGLIVTVLMHSAKGEGLGAIGGGAKMFNNPQKGLESGLDKATAALAVIFLGLAILLSILFA